MGGDLRDPDFPAPTHYLTKAGEVVPAQSVGNPLADLPPGLGAMLLKPPVSTTWTDADWLRYHREAGTALAAEIGAWKDRCQAAWQERDQYLAMVGQHSGITSGLEVQLANALAEVERLKAEVKSQRSKEGDDVAL
jgi:hypothetical protein